ncbi:hypothetical protein KKF34_12815, partial [Myxococcota bacterium]|nr:hypothetical protein [Myxococcota bacterium]
MKNLILFLMTVFLITSCSDDNDNKVTPSNCEAIQDRDECEAAGCVLGGGSFNLLSSDKTKCLGKFYGSMCVAPKVDCNSNTVINWIYKELD